MTDSPTPTVPPPASETSSEAEGRFHHYITHHIPWYVHLLWICYWSLAIFYVLAFLFPSIREAFSGKP